MTTRLCLIIFMVFQFSNACTQEINIMSISSPSSVAGDYEIFLSYFSEPTDITAPLNSLTLARDGNNQISAACDDIQSVSGLAVLVESIGCDPFIKAKEIEDAGGIAAIICTDFEDRVRLNSDDPGALQLDIPVFSISDVHCQELFLELESAPINVNYSFECRTPYYGDHVLWGNQEGEGDFSDGLNDWIVECQMDTCWTWDPAGNAVGSFTNHTILSSSACNGAMIFNSDLLDNGGSGGGGFGPCIAPCRGSLISPNISIPAITDGNILALRFEQAYRQFLSEYSVLVSQDDGATWPDTFNLNLDAIVNSPNVDDEVTIYLPDYSDATSIKFQFLHTGNYYYWIIDDVRLLTLPPLPDCELDCSNISAPAIWETPFFQKVYFPLGANVLNSGEVTAHDVRFNVSVSTEEGTLVWTESIMLDSLQPGESIPMEDMTLIMDRFLLPGNYEVVYEITSNRDVDLRNNVLSKHFVISIDTYANCPRIAEQVSSQITEHISFPLTEEAQNMIDPNYRIGTIFRPSEGGHYVENVNFGVGNAGFSYSGIYAVEIFELDENASQDQVIDQSERTLIGQQEIEVSSVNSFSNFNVSFTFNPVTGILDKIILNENQDYLITIHAKSIDNNLITLSAFDFEGSNDFQNKFRQNWDISKTQELLNLENPARAIGTYYSDLAPDQSNSDSDFEMIFRPEIVPRIQMRISEMVNSSQELEINSTVQIYPNPAKDYLDITRTDDTQFEQLSIIDLNGQVVYQQTLKNETVINLRIPIDYLMEGTYFVKFIGEKNIFTEKVVVTK